MAQAIYTSSQIRTATLDERVQTFMDRLTAYLGGLDRQGINPLRLWVKILSKPAVGESGQFVTDSEGKVVREPIADRNGEVIDDTSFILSCSEQLAREFGALARELTGSKKYASLDLYLPGENRSRRFNLIKSVYNEQRSTWEIYTVQHKEPKGLSFSSCFRQQESAVLPDDIDI